MAKGTLKRPITFTSQMDLFGFSSPASAGEWGGLVIAGNAYTHYTNNKYEADESVAFGSTGHQYDNESSGTLEYVVIKHTGYEIRNGWQCLADKYELKINHWGLPALTGFSFESNDFCFSKEFSCSNFTSNT